MAGGISRITMEKHCIKVSIKKTEKRKAELQKQQRNSSLCCFCIQKLH